MTDRELMQQALDLLDDINQCSLPPTGIPLPAEIDHVMEALRARLAQPEPREIKIEFKEWIDPHIGVLQINPKTPLILKAVIREGE